MYKRQCGLLPFTTKREFGDWHWNKEDACQFAKKRYTMASVWFEPGKAYSTYGLEDALAWFKTQDLRKMCIRDRAGLQSFSSAGLTIWTYVKDGELVSYAVEGSGDENFKDFPEGWNHDFGADRYEKFANWQDAGYIDPDSLSVTDCGTPFEAGLNASIVGTLDDYVDVYKRQGYGSIVYLATITGLDQEMYEAARVDGATRGKCIRYLTLPLLKSTAVMLFIMSIGKIFNGDFGMIYNLVLNNTCLLYTSCLAFIQCLPTAVRRL